MSPVLNEADIPGCIRRHPLLPRHFLAYFRPKDFATEERHNVPRARFQFNLPPPFWKKQKRKRKTKNHQKEPSAAIHRPTEERDTSSARESTKTFSNKKARKLCAFLLWTAAPDRCLASCSQYLLSNGNEISIGGRKFPCWSSWCKSDANAPRPEARSGEYEGC